MLLRLLIAILIALGAAACAGPARDPRAAELAALRQDPDWPRIRAEAIGEVLRREGPLVWHAITHPYAVWPISRPAGGWRVGVAADYPHNTLGRLVELDMDRDGKILRYDRRWEAAKAEAPEPPPDRPTPAGGAQQR